MLKRQKKTNNKHTQKNIWTDPKKAPHIYYSKNLNHITELIKKICV